MRGFWKCVKCGHDLDTHSRKNTACSDKTCSCRFFRADGSRDAILSSLMRKYDNDEGAEASEVIITPYDVAKKISEKDRVLEYQVILSDVLWNPGMYFDEQKSMGGTLTKDEWITLCQKERRATKG